MHTWRIYAVVDPDGNGADFAYTDGLWPDHPELFVWARPTDGSDPGSDWALSPRDRGHLLQGLAEDLVEHRRHIGDRWSESYDGGFTRVHFELRAPVPARATEAHALDEHVPVAVVGFEIDRGRGEERTLDARARTVVGRLAERLDRVEPDRRRAFGPRATDGPVPAGEVVFGEWTALLDAMRRGVVDARTIGPLTGAIIAREQIDTALAVVRAAGRRCGRGEQVIAAEALGRVDAIMLSDLDVEARSDPLWRHALVVHLQAVLATAYGVVVTADLLDATWRARGCGWVWSLADPSAAAARFRYRAERLAGSGDVSSLGVGRDQVDAALVLAASAGHGADLFRPAPSLVADLVALGFPPDR